MSSGKIFSYIFLKFGYERKTHSYTGRQIQEEDIIDSDAACRLLGNISHATLKKYAEICPEIRPAGKYSRGYSRKRLLEFRTLRQQGAFRKNKVYPVC